LTWLMTAAWGGAALGQETAYEPPPTPRLLPDDAPGLGLADAEVDAFVRIPDAREQFHVSGKGLAVVVIDSGVNPVHISFQGQLLPGKNFSTDGNETDTTDRDGHGSNVAGIIAAKAVDPSELMPTGIAPEAKIIPLKVFPGGEFDKINAALQWVLDNRDRYEADHHVTISVVNMSLGSSQNLKSLPGNLADVLKTQRSLIKQLRDKDVAVTVSAGNAYKAFNPNQGMGFPAICPETISVGAVFDTRVPPHADGTPLITYKGGASVFRGEPGRLVVFSQRLGEDEGREFRTDIFAPGFIVTSMGPLVPAGSGQDPTRTRTTDDGTSQASPVTAGVVLLLQHFYRLQNASIGLANNLPTVDVIEASLRQGGEQIRDVEDDLARQMDNVESCGATFVRLDAVKAISFLKDQLRGDLQALQLDLLRAGGKDQQAEVLKKARVLSAPYQKKHKE
jgi:subtilisin family serine protease